MIWCTHYHKQSHERKVHFDPISIQFQHTVKVPSTKDYHNTNSFAITRPYCTTGVQRCWSCDPGQGHSKDISASHDNELVHVLCNQGKKLHNYHGILQLPLWVNKFHLKSHSKLHSLIKNSVGIRMHKNIDYIHTRHQSIGQQCTHHILGSLLLILTKYYWVPTSPQCLLSATCV